MRSFLLVLLVAILLGMPCSAGLNELPPAWNWLGELPGAKLVPIEVEVDEPIPPGFSVAVLMLPDQPADTVVTWLEDALKQRGLEPTTFDLEIVPGGDGRGTTRERYARINCGQLTLNLYRAAMDEPEPGIRLAGKAPYLYLLVEVEDR
jgi:hypothetical protein